MEITPLISVVLDANVLFSAALRDTLLWAAQNRLYELFYTDEILEEVRRNLVATNRAQKDRAAALVQTMKMRFPDGIVLPADYQPRIATMRNNPKDRHVLAATVAAGANYIVTFNLKDFPEHALTPNSVQALSPDEFMLRLFRRDSQGWWKRSWSKRRICGGHRKRCKMCWTPCANTRHRLSLRSKPILPRPRKTHSKPMQASFLPIFTVRSSKYGRFLKLWHKCSITPVQNRYSAL